MLRIFPFTFFLLKLYIFISFYLFYKVRLDVLMLNLLKQLDSIVILQTILTVQAKLKEKLSKYEQLSTSLLPFLKPLIVNAGI